MKDYDYSELFPGRFLQAIDFKGKEVTLTVAEVELEEMPDKKARGGKKAKPILSFKGTKKQLVLNPTNGGCLKGMFCDPVRPRTSEWIGKRVTFYPVLVEAFGTQKLAIRVRGSPDIERDMTFSYQCGQEARTVTMKRTGTAAPAKPTNGNGRTAAATPDPQPADDGLEGLPPDEGELEQIPGQPPL